MEEAELTEIPEAEVMEEREEWMNVHTWRDTIRWSYEQNKACFNQ